LEDFSSVLALNNSVEVRTAAADPTSTAAAAATSAVHAGLL
jgi:hypothetical protein